MSGRDLFLQRVKRAVADGNRAGIVPPLPERGSLGYQGAGDDPVACFRQAFTAAGGVLHLVPDDRAARLTILELIQARGARKVLLGRGTYLDQLDMNAALGEVGLEVWPADAATTDRDARFAADVGVSGVEYLIAETGSVVAVTRPAEPRSLTLLPPVHIAAAHREQILPDLFDLYPRLPKNSDGTPDLPSCVTLITGPSKTGDIELKLVTGVHGPGEIHVVLWG
jgi:L-lactate dehydrogenase complex protein LldG